MPMVLFLVICCVLVWPSPGAFAAGRRVDPVERAYQTWKKLRHFEARLRKCQAAVRKYTRLSRGEGARSRKYRRYRAKARREVQASRNQIRLHRGLLRRRVARLNARQRRRLARKKRRRYLLIVTCPVRPPPVERKIQRRGTFQKPNGYWDRWRRNRRAIVLRSSLSFKGLKVYGGLPAADVLGRLRFGRHALAGCFQKIRWSKGEVAVIDLEFGIEPSGQLGKHRMSQKDPRFVSAARCTLGRFRRFRFVRARRKTQVFVRILVGQRSPKKGKLSGAGRKKSRSGSRR